MKKALALVLALVLALSLGVSAFALNLVVLKPAKPDYPDPTEITNELVLNTTDSSAKNPVYVAPAEGGDFYFQLKGYSNLKDITVTTTGNVTAEIVKFNPATMVFPEDSNIQFLVVDTKDEVNQWVSAANINAYLGANGYNIYPTEAEYEAAVATDKKAVLSAELADWTDYAYAADYARLMNSVVKVPNRFVVVAFDFTDGVEVVELNLVKVTVGENYSASYKEGSFKVSATNKVTKKAVSYTATIISDVVIFEYNEVKWAAADGELRAQSVGGYSDYETSINGYKDVLGADYDYEDLRQVPAATVVPTTAFRAIVGEDLVVCAGNDDDNYVVIYDVAKGQKGVNFAWHGFEYYNAEGKKITDGKEVGKTAEVKFGYYGKQTIASDFDVVITPGCDYTDLLKLFGLKVEEEDIVTYYVLKDGKAIGSFDIDYADVEEAYAPVQIKIEGKAGDTLGEYSVAIKAPVAPSEGEENPNTGAESVIGVVAAMAVVSVAAAAAVSLKK